MKQVILYNGGSKVVGGVRRSGAGRQIYAPWKYTHKQTITYNLSQIARDNKISIKELVYQIIVHGIAYIPTVNDVDYDASVDAFDRDAINYALWKIYFPKEQDKAQKGYLAKYRKDKCLAIFEHIKSNYDKIISIKYNDSIMTTVNSIRENLSLIKKAYEMEYMPKEYKDSLYRFSHYLRQHEIIRLFCIKKADRQQYNGMIRKAISDYPPNNINTLFYQTLAKEFKDVGGKEDAIMIYEEMADADEVATRKYALNELVDLCIENNQPLEALNYAYRLYYIDFSCESEIVLCTILHKNNQIKEVKKRWKKIQKTYNETECFATLRQYLIDNGIIKK